MKNIKKVLIVAAAVRWGVGIVFAITKLYSIWQNKYRTPDNPLYPTELVYKNTKGKNLRLDVYRPADTAAIHKTLIYVHGGTWISGTKRKVQDEYRYDAIKTMLANNIEVVSIDYSLIGRQANTLENCIYDCGDAVKFCIENAHYLGIDTAHIGLWGSSAGAHVAMMCYIQLPNQDNIKCIIDDFGPTDLSVMWAVFPDWVRRFMSTIFFHMHYRDLKKFDILTKAFSPLYYTKSLSKVPILISHGDKDRIVNRKQSQWLNDSLPNTSDLKLFEGQGHGFKTMDDEMQSEYTKRVMNFVNENL